jgi:hypothetical protein
MSAVLAYALGGVLNKGIANALYSERILPLVPLTAVILVGLLGFSTELGALRDGFVSIVVPIVLALHTIVPIICALFLFGEARPADPLPRASGWWYLPRPSGALLLFSSSSPVLVKR